MVECFWWDSSLILTTNWIPSVLWQCWFGHLACKNCPWNDLLCVEWDVKPYTLTQSIRDRKCKVDEKNESILYTTYFNGHTQSKSWPLIFLHRLFQNCAWKYDEANMQTLMCPGCQHNTRAQQTDNSSPLHMRSKWVRTMQHRSYQVIARDHCDQVTDWLIMYPITPILNFSLTLYHKGWPLCTSLCNSFLQQPQDYNFTTDYWHGSKFVPNISLIFLENFLTFPWNFPTPRPFQVSQDLQMKRSFCAQQLLSRHVLEGKFTSPKTWNFPPRIFATSVITTWILKLTSNPWVVKLSWLENAYSRPVLSTGDLGQESRSGWPGFNVRLGFGSASVRARLQVSVYSGYDLCNPVCPKIWFVRRCK